MVYNPIRKDFKYVKFLSKDNKVQLFSTRNIGQINETDIVLSGNKIIVIENPWKEIDQKKNPKIYIKSSLKIAANRVQCFLQNSNSQLWFGTDKGLMQCKYVDGKIETVRQYTENKTGNSKLRVLSHLM